MLKHIFTTGFKSLFKEKGFTIINIIGLSIGIAATIIILLYLSDQLSYDQFNEKKERIYRLENEKWAILGTKYGPVLEREFPEIESYVRFDNFKRDALLSYKEKNLYVDNFIFADSGIFNTFSFNMIQGHPAKAFSDPYSIVLTEEYAKKIFGNKNPVGEVLEYHHSAEFKVTGVIENVDRFHMDIGAIGNFACLGDLRGDDEFFDHWDTWNHPTYVLLNKNHDVEKLEAKINKYFSDKALWNEKGEEPGFKLRNLNDVYFEREAEVVSNKRGNINIIYAFSAIAGFILLIACFNFINLSTAKALRRAKEVGIRKVTGATKNQLITQFLGESFFMVVVSAVLALILVEISLPEFNMIVSNNLRLSYNSTVILYLVAGILIITLIAGLYPAFYLTRFRPVQVLKGDVTKGRKGGFFRKTLLVIQFMISIALIASTIIVHRQLSYINNYDIGFNKDHIVMFRMNKDQQKNLQTFRNELLSKSSITRVSYANQPQGNVRWTNSLTIDGEDIPYKFAPVDPYHIDLMGLNLIQGRNFQPGNQSDINNTFILNETAVKAFGLEEPVVGQKVKRHNRTVTIIGVVEDYHFNSLHETIEPLVLGWTPGWHSLAYVKINGKNIQQGLQDLEEVWMDFSPEFPVKYSFLDKQFEQLYQKEQRMASVFIYFSGLAIFIAALGLFGLAAYSVGQKRKEIGIRKVLGAPVERIIGKLVKDFTIWAAVANIIAWPVAWYFMDKWLSNFAYAYKINGVAFLLAAIITLVIAVTTVFYQSWRSAQTNPVDSLRYE